MVGFIRHQVATSVINNDENRKIPLDATMKKIHFINLKKEFTSHLNKETDKTSESFSFSKLGSYLGHFRGQTNQCSSHGKKTSSSCEQSTKFNMLGQMKT